MITGAGKSQLDFLIYQYYRAFLLPGSKITLNVSVMLCFDRRSCCIKNHYPDFLFVVMKCLIKQQYLWKSKLNNLHNLSNTLHSCMINLDNRLWSLSVVCCNSQDSVGFFSHVEHERQMMSSGSTPIVLDWSKERDMVAFNDSMDGKSKNMGVFLGPHWTGNRRRCSHWTNVRWQEVKTLRRWVTYYILTYLE